MLPAFAQIRQRPPSRPVRAWCWFGLVLAAVVGCGDSPADPIVLLEQGGSGVDGSVGKGGVGPGDLCAPCSARADCAAMEACAQFTHNGDRFCSQPCGDGDGHCPVGYTCMDVVNLTSMQCVPETGDCSYVVP